jgi:hypothetical protein
MRKFNSSKAPNYFDLKALTTTILASQNPARHFGFAVSRTPATTAQSNERNKVVSVDWAIINKENLPDVFNAFALFHDVNIRLVHVEFQPTRGQVGEALEGYIQRWGTPHTIHHDNAREIIFGKLASVCRDNKIIQTQSAPLLTQSKPGRKIHANNCQWSVEHGPFSIPLAYLSGSSGVTLSLTESIFKTT